VHAVAEAAEKVPAEQGAQECLVCKYMPASHDVGSKMVGCEVDCSLDSGVGTVVCEDEGNAVGEAEGSEVGEAEGNDEGGAVGDMLGTAFVSLSSMSCLDLLAKSLGGNVNGLAIEVLRRRRRMTFFIFTFSTIGHDIFEFKRKLKISIA